MTEDSLYVLTYTSWNHSVARLAVAVSKDLVHWQKKGSAFAVAYNGKIANLYCKSGAIVTRFDKNGRQVAAKFNNRYWMYWGEGSLYLAWSDNLWDWYIPG